MMRWLVLLLLPLPEPSPCFSPPNNVHRSHQNDGIKLSTAEFGRSLVVRPGVVDDSEGDSVGSSSRRDGQTQKAEPAVNGKSSSRARRARCVTYPSFAYTYQRPRELRSFKVWRRRGDARLTGEKVNPDELLDPELTDTFALSSFASDLNVDLPFAPELKRILDSSRKTRLLEERSYAVSGPFARVNITRPPSLSDLSAPPSQRFDKFWVSTPARFLSFAAAYFSFPYLTRFLDHFVTMPPDQLDEITSKFTPGITILYGTFVSLTLSILYTRQQDIQDNVAVESSLVTMMLRSVLSLFRKDRESSVEAAQCVADQIRTLVRGSRGAELMGLMYTDPYARILELVEFRSYELMEKNGDLGGDGVLIGFCRDTIKDLMKIRAQRLSDEALALPPTHYFILTSLTLLILLGYTVSILPAVDRSGMPSNESSLLFGVLCTVYILFYNFTNDLNNPFQGVYQIRRSSTASHLLQAKWLMANHPYLRGEVDFEEVMEDFYGDVTIRSPGLGDLIFEKEYIYPDEKKNKNKDEKVEETI